ncbi:MAG: AmmeMemoRadiSam system radical SAM enzyme [Verrucomicrobia bacterium]|nr:MAG: AmmeMemoRadiSam system radical SAM enzyme [Verrucomicrobiota bacterium]
MAAVVQCELCPRRCEIAPDGRGDCRVRVNLDGKLTALTYGYPCSLHIDPMEKKPVFHFLPGTPTLSLATVGCNLHCKNCQNWEISQRNPEDVEAMELPPAKIVELARQNGCPSISYTYTDPIIFYEYVLDTAMAARVAGLKNILITAGYINPDPARELFRVTDVARIDLKAMSEDFYRDVCEATLQPVLDTILLAKEMALEVEIVHLIVTTLNDGDADLKKLCDWVVKNVGRDVPLHFSRFSPQHKLAHLPPTPIETLHRARDIAQAAGSYYVYLGNILEEDAAHTQCPKCKKVLVRRTGFSVLENRVRAGKCPDCGTRIYGVWN